MKKVCIITWVCLCCLGFSIRAISQDSRQFDRFKAFVLPSYTILDASAGDLNNDGYVDYALVLRSENEDRNGDELRPLLLLGGSKSGRLSLVARNDSVVLCRNCGGMLGDPFQQVTINDGILSVEHGVGSNWRWSRNISFRYDPELDDFVLDNDVTSSYRQFDTGKQSIATTHKEEEIKQPFRSYSFTKSRRRN